MENKKLTPAQNKVLASLKAGVHPGVKKNNTIDALIRMGLVVDKLATPGASIGNELRYAVKEGK